MVVADTEHTCLQYLSTSRGGGLPKARRLVVRWITDWEKGRVFHLGYPCQKTVQPVLEVFRSKHPEDLPLTASSLEAYGGKTPSMMLVDITNAKVANIARLLSGAAGPGGADLVSLQHCLLKFGAASMGIRHIVREFGDWMANSRPPWAA